VFIISSEFEFQDKEHQHVEEVDQKSSNKHVEISAHDMVSSCLLSITVNVETLLS
jgi:hypothetical protein